MDTLYPLDDFLSGNVSSGTDRSITILINRVVTENEEGAFLETLKTLLAEFAAESGALSSKVFRRKTGNLVEFSIVQRFASEADHGAWQKSPGFARWQEAVAPPTPNPGHLHRYSGMEALFVPAKSPDAPPRWKMAVILTVAVFPVSLAVSIWGAPMLARLPLAAGTLLTSAVMVVLMTYVLVPFLTKIFAWWLQPEIKDAKSP